MATVGQFAFVFVAGLITDLATGLGALPYFFVEEVSERWNVGLWGLASGIMVSASLFGLVREGLATGGPVELGVGLLAGVVLVVVAHRVITGHHMEAEEIAEADLKKLVLILGILTVHSFPEGVAIGVSFAELGLVGGVDFYGFAVPVLAIFMTIAISIHNIPEGLAISIPLSSHGMSKWQMVGAAVFSSIPQPIGAVIAFGFVRLAKQFMPVGFGFAAGAMVYLVLTEFIPEAIEAGEGLRRGGYPELVTGVVAGFLVMIPLAFL